MNRIQEIDALRGIALFGILLVNIFVFHAPYSYYGEFYGAFEGPQLTTVNLVVDFAGGKFLFIFAFLFGYGFQIQAASQKKDFNRFYFRKMALLLLMGVMHILLFWFGDILGSYALLGMIMLLLVKLPQKLLLPLGIILLLFRPMYYVGNVIWDWPSIGMLKPLEMDEFLSVFQNGSYIEVFTARMKEFIAYMPENLVWYIPKTLGLFLIGYFCAGKNFTVHISQHKARYILISTLLFGAYLFWARVKQDFFASFNLDETPILRPALIAINVTFETALGAFYIIGFLLFFQNFKKASNLMAMTGKMALTNYITQSLLCVIIFYSYGFGLYGKLKPTDLVLISLLIFAVNVLFSWLYLKRYKKGPLEYLWRKMSDFK